MGLDRGGEREERWKTGEARGGTDGRGTFAAGSDKKGGSARRKLTTNIK